METAGADLVGKAAHFLYDAGLDQTYLMQGRSEHRFTSHVPGASFVARRATWEKVPFAHRHARVDSTFVRGVAALGLRVYSTSRFEFAVGRGTAGHTWHADPSLYAAHGESVGDGFRGGDIFLSAE